MSTISRKQEIFNILNACDDCDPSQCCRACDNVCDTHELIHAELYAIFEQEEKKCSECEETNCEWLQENEGVCCKDNRDLEYPKFCSPCAEDKTADMIDTAMDMDKDGYL